MAGEALFVVVGLSVQTAGIVLMVVGAAGLVASFVLWRPWRSSRTHADAATTGRVVAGPSSTGARATVQPLRVPGARRSRVTLAPGYPWDDLRAGAPRSRRRAS